MSSRHPRFRVPSASLAAILAAAAVVMPGSAVAQRRPQSAAQMEAQAARFKPGQWVEVERFGKWEPGEVTEVKGPFVSIRLLTGDWAGHESSAFPDKVRGMTPEKAAKVKKAVADAEKAKANAEKAEAEAGKAEQAKRDAAVADRAKRKADAAAGPKVAPTSLDGVAAAVPRAGAWAYQPAAAPVPAKKLTKSIPLPSPFQKGKDESRFWEKLEGISAPGGEAGGTVLLARWTDGTGDDVQRRLQVVDLAAGRVAANLLLPDGTLVRDVSPDGKRVLLQSSAWPHTKGGNRLDVYDVVDGGKSLKHAVSFMPFPENKDSHWGNDLTFAQLLDAGHVLTFGVGGKLLLWDLAGGNPRPVYAIDLGSDGGWTIPRPRFNPERTVIAARRVKGDLFLIDARTGKTLGSIPASTTGGGEPAFDAAGKRLAMSGGKGIQVFDLAAGGKLTHDLGLQIGVGDPTGRGDVDLRFAGDGFLLLRGSDLLDLSKGIVVWEYDTSGAGNLAPLAGGTYALVTGEMERGRPGAAAKAKVAERMARAKRGPAAGAGAPAAPAAPAKAAGEGMAVTTFALPHDAAVKRAAAIPAGAFLAVQPGMTASIDVELTSGGGPADLRERAIKRVTEQLAANGIAVAAQPQSLRAVIASKPGETKQQKYGSGVGPFAKEAGSASVQEVWHSVSLVLDGKECWSARGGSSLPATVWLKEGQSIQQVVDEMRAGSFAFFDNVTLPKTVLKPKELLPPGKSKVGAEGVMDTDVPPVPQPTPLAGPKAAPAKAPANGDDGLD